MFHLPLLIANCPHTIENSTTRLQSLRNTYQNWRQYDIHRRSSRHAKNARILVYIYWL